MPDYVTYTLYGLMALGWIYLLYRLFQVSAYFQKRFNKRLQALHAEASEDDGTDRLGSS